MNKVGMFLQKGEKKKKKKVNKFKVHSGHTLLFIAISLSILVCLYCIEFTTVQFCLGKVSMIF